MASPVVQDIAGTRIVTRLDDALMTWEAYGYLKRRVKHRSDSSFIDACLSPGQNTSASTWPFWDVKGAIPYCDQSARATRGGAIRFFAA